MVTAIAQGAGHRLGHATATKQGKRDVLGHLVGLQQLGNGDVVGVEGLEMAVGIDDGIDRLDGCGRRVQFVDQGNAGFLERHRYAATANTQGADAADGPRQILAGKRLVVEIQPQLLIQMIVKSQAKVPGPSGEGHAQLGVSVGVHLHVNLLVLHFRMDGISRSIEF
ncbi:hypothetical protein D9M71_326260 [compost metagenome]